MDHSVGEELAGWSHSKCYSQSFDVHWHSMPREAVDHPSVKVFKTVDGSG